MRWSREATIACSRSPAETLYDPSSPTVGQYYDHDDASTQWSRTPSADHPSGQEPITGLEWVADGVVSLSPPG